jgi:hypothetical protein
VRTARAKATPTPPSLASDCQGRPARHARLDNEQKGATRLLLPDASDTLRRAGSTSSSLLPRTTSGRPSARDRGRRRSCFGNKAQPSPSRPSTAQRRGGGARHRRACPVVWDAHEGQPVSGSATACRPTQQRARTATRLLALPLPRMSSGLDLRSRCSSVAMARASSCDVPHSVTLVAEQESRPGLPLLVEKRRPATPRV